MPVQKLSASLKINVLFWRGKCSMLPCEMSMILNGNGNGNGAGLLRQAQKKAVSKTTTTSGDKESHVTFETAEGIKLRGALSSVTRHGIVFELYNPSVTPRFSEVLNEFNIVMQSHIIYSGRAVISKVLDAGTKVICEAQLNESGWIHVARTIAQAYKEGNLIKEFNAFLADWQKSYKVLPEFKVAIADLQMILSDLRLWLDKIDVEIQSQAPSVRGSTERMLIGDLQDPILTAIEHLLEKFELIALQVTPDLRPAHIAFMQNQIHPFVLSAPFIHRTFFKPLGYAGDYEMVNMMVRNPYEGNSLFAKILNYIFLNTPPVKAHRDRLTYLTQMLRDETLRARVAGNKSRVKIFNLGCGPAKEIQDFIAEHHICDWTEFMLLDFNEETLSHTSNILEKIKTEHKRTLEIKWRKKSVQQVLREAPKLEKDLGKFDIVYCAGLFDYLTDNVCEKLLEFFYKITKPGGLVVATNVADTNPSRGWMEYMLDWHLIYRSVEQFKSLVPAEAQSESTVRAVGKGVNIVMEIKKQNNDRK